MLEPLLVENESHLTIPEEREAIMYNGPVHEEVLKEAFVVQPIRNVAKFSQLQCQWQLALHAKQEALQHDGKDNAERLVPPRQVAREQSTGLSFERFWRQYHTTGVPVVVQGMAWRMLPRTGGLNFLQDLREKCGHRHVVPRRAWREGLVTFGGGGRPWAGLEPGKETTLGAFLSSQKLFPPAAAAEAAGSPSATSTPSPQNRTSDPEESLYLFDWGLSSNCPQVLQELIMPSYIAGDAFRLFPHSVLDHNWPSLLVGPAGSRSTLHIDADSTHFYLLLLQGRKRWRVYPAEDRAALYHDAVEDIFLLSGFESEAERDAFRRGEAPLLGKAVPWEFIQEPGELVLIPHLWCLSPPLDAFVACVLNAGVWWWWCVCVCVCVCVCAALIKWRI